MSAGFTPPPWHCGDEDESVLGVHYVDVHAGEYCTPSYRCVASVEGPFVDNKFRELDDETRANANLIAAAPELYEAADDARLFVELVRMRAAREGDEDQAREAAEALAGILAVLAKARGEAA